MGIFDEFFLPNSQTGNIRDIDEMVNVAISYYEDGNIPMLQNQLYETYSCFNKPGGGRLVTQFRRKDKLCEFFCFCLMYDWTQDEEIKEVFAEDGFYSIVSYLSHNARTEADMIAGCLNWFLLLCYGKKNLINKFEEIIKRAETRGERIFTANDYIYGAKYVIRQFMFFSANVISNYVESHQIISQNLIPVYEMSRNDPAFQHLAPELIFAKANFFSGIIESILNDM